MSVFPRRKKRAAAVLLAASLLFLSGCAGNREREHAEADTLYVAEVASAFPATFMPWFSRDGVAPTISSMLYSTLLDYDEQTDTFHPLLARDWAYLDRAGTPLKDALGQVDFEGLERNYAGKDTAFIPVRFELDPEARWSDGTPVTAEDVYFTFDLAANQKISNHAGALVWVNDLLHKYDSATGKLRRQGIFTWETGANEAGYPISPQEKDRVFYLELSKVLGAITPLVSTVLILPKHIYGGIVTELSPLNSTEPTAALRKAYENPVGCGPYRLDRARTNAQEIVLLRRADYHRKDADGSFLYKAETIRFVLYQEINVAIYALKKGHVDVLDAAVSANYATLFKEDRDVTLFSAPGVFVQCLVLNLNAPAERMTRAREQLARPELRRALALAVDQEALIRHVLSGRGRKVPSGLIAQGEMYNPEADLTAAPYGERLMQANALLDTLYPAKDAKGYRLDGERRLRYEILGSPSEQDLISYLQVLFQKIGVEVAFAAKGNAPENTFLYGGNFDMTLQSLIFSPENVDIMMNAHFVNLNRSSNYGRLKDPLLSAGIARMRGTLNRNLKYEAVKEVQLLAAKHYYKLPLFSQDILSLARTDRFTGWSAGPGLTAFNLGSLTRLMPAGAQGR